MKNTLTQLSILASITSISNAEELTLTTKPTQPVVNDHNHHDHHNHRDTTPIGVMGAHIHQKEEWMFSYRFMQMEMDQNYDGDSRISDAQVLASPDFMVTPTDMTMNMHMFGIMYAPTDKLTLMGMVNYVEASMNHITAMGGRFRTQSSGLGDSSLTALYSILNTQNNKMHVGLGLQLPTAKLDAEGFIPPAGAILRLPYPMQLGQGTLALQPSITYLHQQPNWSFGSQIKGNIQLADNSEDYRPGSSAEATAWLARDISEKASVSFRLKGALWGNISGSDPEILPLPVPTTRTDLRGGFRFDAALGLNLYNILGPLDLGVEVSKPLYQNLDGPQLGRDWDLTLGIKYTW